MGSNSSNFKALLTYKRTNKHVCQIANVMLSCFENLGDLLFLNYCLAFCSVRNNNKQETQKQD